MTEQQLSNLGIDAKWLNPLNDTFTKYNINTINQQAAFIGQCQHESANFTKLEENLNYSAVRLMAVWPSRFPNLDVANQYANNPEKLANKVYGGRADLGNTQDGDGFKFHGRGCIQLTGRDSYERCGLSIGMDFLSNPDRLLDPQYAIMSAGWFWNKKGLNDLANNEDWQTMTKRINGGLVGLDDRINKIHKAMDILGA
jgi:putative chitinase